MRAMLIQAAATLAHLWFLAIVAMLATMLPLMCFAAIVIAIVEVKWVLRLLVIEGLAPWG